MRGPNLDKLRNWGIFTVISAGAGLVELGFFSKNYFFTHVAFINALSFGFFAIRIAKNPDKIDGED